MSGTLGRQEILLLESDLAMCLFLVFQDEYFRKFTNCLVKVPALIFRIKLCSGSFCMLVNIVAF